jgi:hypothetical protein
VVGFASVSHALQVNAKLNGDFVRKLSAKVRRNPLSSSLQSLSMLAVNQIESMILMTDFEFSAFKRDDPDFDLVRQALREDGMLPLEIFR